MYVGTSPTKAYEILRSVMDDKQCFLKTEWDSETKETRETKVRREKQNSVSRCNLRIDFLEREPVESSFREKERFVKCGSFIASAPTSLPAVPTRQILNILNYIF